MKRYTSPRRIVMYPEVQYRAIRLAAAVVMVAAAACSDATAPTRLSPQAEPSFAVGGGGGSIVKSMVGLEPLLEASTNIGGPNSISDLGRVVGFSRDGSNHNRAVIWDKASSKPYPDNPSGPASIFLFR